MLIACFRWPVGELPNNSYTVYVSNSILHKLVLAEVLESVRTKRMLHILPYVQLDYSHGRFICRAEVTLASSPLLLGKVGS